MFEEMTASPAAIRKGNSQPSPGSTENPRQDKPKEENIETRGNQTDQN